MNFVYRYGIDFSLNDIDLVFRMSVVGIDSIFQLSASYRVFAYRYRLDFFVYRYASSFGLSVVGYRYRFDFLL